ncbi:hypothetical protein GGR21_002754 [Dysgonomonas hofstadii]|uniref:Uncharacterized protein n=1 Tax=Dysgonomonas hofstadii TaxID=637886 RepID=A0A840CP28_9BACT|nr:hypothetical protein [Dysgonomonas hofstadii]
MERIDIDHSMMHSLVVSYPVHLVCGIHERVD